MTQQFVPAKKCIGPSKLASILGLSRWCSRDELKEQLENGYLEEANAMMTFGTEKEPVARLLYQQTYGIKVDIAPFARDSVTRRLVGKADGLIGSDGGLEIKCHYPGKPALQSIPEYYLVQVVAYMFLYRREWWDFMSCAFNEEGQLIESNVIRIYWKNYEQTWTREWYPEICKFIREVKWVS